MNTSSNHLIDDRLKQVALLFNYPVSPDVAREVIKRLESGSRPRAQLRSAGIIASVVILALAILFAVPGVRAEIIRFFQVGVVRIFPSTETQTAIPATPQTPLTATPSGSLTPQRTNTPFSSQPEPLYSITTSGLAGETSLEAARDRLSFSILLPAYPPDLDSPDRVFLPETDQMVILVWTDSENPDEVRLSLHEIGPGSVIIGKFQPRVIQETQVDGNYAVWAQGPYLVQLSDGTYNWRRLVAGNTLIWEVGSITYRLESNLTLEETIRIAESLR